MRSVFWYFMACCLLAFFCTVAIEAAVDHELPRGAETSYDDVARKRIQFLKSRIQARDVDQTKSVQQEARRQRMAGYKQLLNVRASRAAAAAAAAEAAPNAPPARSMTTATADDSVATKDAPLRSDAIKSRGF